MNAPQRSAILQKMGEHLQATEPHLAEAWRVQVGGLASLAPSITSIGTMTFSSTVAMTETFEFEKQIESQMVPAAIIAREPVGVVAAIAPWNAPYIIMITKVAHALAAGCTVIMKPAPETPMEAYLIAQAGEAAGLPAGVLNVVCGDRDASNHLVKNEGVDKVSFTGSTEAGKHIGAICASRVARCTLELGGKSAAIIRDDFPIDLAAQLLAGTITTMSGQVTEGLNRGEIDLAIGSFGSLAKNFHRIPLYTETMNVIMCENHPLANRKDGDEITKSDLVAYAHLVVSQNQNIESTALSRWLLSKSIERKVGFVVEHVSLVPEMLKQTQLICLGTERSFDYLKVGKQGLVSKRLPLSLGTDQYEIEMIWHERTDDDEELRPLRDLIAAHSKGLAS